MDWYKYKVVWWNECEEKDLTAYGITCGGSYAEAMEHIEKHFGDTIQSIEHLEMISDDNSCYELDQEQYDNIGDNF